MLARLAWPHFTARRRLEDLAVTHLGWTDVVGGMERAFKAAGYRKQEDGWRGMDIDSPIYRQGAMFDTIATLRIEPLIHRPRSTSAWTIRSPPTGRPPVSRPPRSSTPRRPCTG